MSTLLFWLPVAFYLAGWLGEFVSYASLHRDRDRYRWSGGLLAIGWGAHTLLLAYLLREWELQVSTMLNMASWAAMIFYYIVLLRMRSTVIRLVFPPLAVALLITAFFSVGRDLLGEDGFALTLTTTRNILTAHIISVLAGTLLFGLACLASIVYLYEERQIKAKLRGLLPSRLPSLATLERYNHKAITLGFFFLTIGLLLGLVVAGINTLSHRLFSVRQVIPTLVWLAYATFLLAHDIQGWRGRFGALWSIAGFLVVITSLVFEIFFLVSKA